MNHQKTKSKKLLSLLLALTMTLSLGLFQNTALAEIVSTNDFLYELNTQKMEAMVFQCFSNTATNIVIPDKINHNGKSYTVTAIRDAVFQHCENLTKITIPNGVQSIGVCTFSNCKKLEEVNIPNRVLSIGERAFSSCESLTEITIPNGVQSIGAGAFMDCKNLTKVVLPNDITSIEEVTFSDCEKLKEINIPNGVQSIGKSAFRKCESLTEITIPDGVKSIGQGAFWSCENLNKVVLPNDITSIEDFTFAACRKLKEINIPDGVRSIGNLAFEVCESLPEIIIPHGVKSIGNNAFCACKNLTKVVLPISITSIGNWAFKECIKLKEINIPNGVRSIGEHAFSNCESLIELVLPDSVTSIKSGAFAFCKKLKEITVPNEIKTIEYFTFVGCENLTKLTLPKSLKRIANDTFPSSPIEDIYYMGTQTEWNSLEIGVFDNDSLRKATVHFSDGTDRPGNPAYSSYRRVTIGDFEYQLNPIERKAALVVCKNKDIANVVISDRINYNRQSYAVIAIGRDAFLNCKNLTEITLPNGIRSIEYGAFYGCKNLVKAILPNNLLSIERFAFNDCSNLKDIYYNGTQAEWEAIEIGDFGNDALKTANVHLQSNPGTTPGNPSNPGTATPPSVTPPVPGTPGTPGNPSNPSTPGNPSNPGTATPPSVTPYVPNEPGTPSVPSSPNTPNTSNKPSTPSTPNKPADKNNPTEPGKENAAPKSITLTEVKTALTEKLTKSESLAPTVFADTEQHWAKESIQFMNKLGILNGIKETEFAPHEVMTRAMFITALGRLSNVNEQDYSASSFGDVPADAYYRSFAEWAKTAGISSGTQMGSFAPNQPISREQIATMIFRFAKYLGYELPVVQAKAAFADEAQISSWAKEAVIALQQAGILQGKGNQMFDPQGKASRAEIAALLQRLVQAIMK